MNCDRKTIAMAARETNQNNGILLKWLDDVIDTKKKNYNQFFKKRTLTKRDNFKKNKNNNRKSQQICHNLIRCALSISFFMN